MYIITNLQLYIKYKYIKRDREIERKVTEKNVDKSYYQTNYVAGFEHVRVVVPSLDTRQKQSKYQKKSLLV